MIEVGAAIIDITPPAGLAMAGFAARSDAATGAHDALTARALVVGETAIVTVDVIGIDAQLSKRVRERCHMPAHAVTIAATHTHGGPHSMPGRLAADPDAMFMEKLEDGLVDAINSALKARVPARTYGGTAGDPGYAKNRRHADGSIDHGVPVVRFDDQNGDTIAVLVSYACHPVVLGPDNQTWTGDYVHFCREKLETEYPGAIVLCATGCAGDVNTGHSAASSLTNQARAERSFTAAQHIGFGLAQSVLSTDLAELRSDVSATVETYGRLEFELRESGSSEHLSATWRAAAETDQAGGQIFNIWADWADNIMGQDIEPRLARCTASNLCGALVVALPGEIFAQTAIEIRASLPTDAPVFVLAYADDNPGYIPPRAEYQHGGYEVDEAHRFYGLGAAFAPGTAERLADVGCQAAQLVSAVTKQINQLQSN